MSEKNLSEKEWKTFSLGRNLKDSAFSKALAALEKAATPDRELAAIAEIEKQAGALLRAHRADRELRAYLDMLDRSLALHRQEARARLAGRPASEDDDEPETPALLTTAMAPLLRRVRQGQQLPVLVASVGRRVALLIAPRPIAPGRRQLLADYLGAGTPRFIPGHCVFEDDAYTFVLKTQVAGMAKKLRAAVQAQAQLRVKVRARGEDPADVDEDLGSEADPPTDPDEAPDVGAGPGPAAEPGASRHPGAPPVAQPGPLPAGADSRALTARLSGLKAVLRQARLDGGDAGRAAAELLHGVREAAGRHDYAAAQAAVDRFEASLQAPRPPLGAAEAQAVRAAIQAEFSAMRGALGSSLALGVSDPDWFRSQRQPAKDLRDKLDRLLAEAAPDPAELRRTLDALQALAPAMADMNTKRDALEAFRRDLEPAVLSALALDLPGDAAAGQARAALAAAVARVSPPTSLAGATPRETQDVIAAVQAALTAFRQHLAARLAQQARPGPGGGPAAVRARLVADPAQLGLIAGDASGRALLDRLVADIGVTARGEADNRFMRQALDARYQTRFSGDLAASAGPRLYRVFGQVPEAHAAGNGMIAAVRRNKNFKSSSWYDSLPDAAAGLPAHHIVINGVRTGGLKGWGADLLANMSPVTRYRNVRGDRKMNVFDATTLHEIGHGVDEKLGFMDREGSQSRYGGWLEHSVREVAEIIAGQSGLLAAFPGQPKDMLEALLEQALQAGFNLSAFRRDKGLAAAAGVNWSAIGRHGAVSLCQAIRLKGSTGLWEKGEGARKFALGGRVYHESYAGDWCSYEVDALATRISNYQFRAPGEWFAEAYSAFYQDKLPDRHPLTEVLMAQA